MTQSAKPRFAPVLRSLLEEDARAMDHATPEQLMDHHAGRLPQDQAALLDRHLRGCQECAGLLRDLAEFEEFTPPPAAEALEDRQAQAAWGRLNARLPNVKPLEEAKTSRPMSVVLPKPVERPRRSWWQRPEPAWALAAVLSVCVIGLSLSVRSMSRQLDDLARPKVNGAFATLYGEDDPTRGEDLIHVPEGGGFLTLALHLDSSSFAIYEADVQPATKTGGGPVWRVEGLKRSDDGRLSFDLGRSLSPGLYRIDLFGIQDGDRRPVNKYLFRIVSP